MGIIFLIDCYITWNTLQNRFFRISVYLQFFVAFTSIICFIIYMTEDEYIFEWIMLYLFALNTLNWSGQNVLIWKEVSKTKKAIEDMDSAPMTPDQTNIKLIIVADDSA